MKKRKITIALSLGLTTIAPVVAVVSCGDSTKKVQLAGRDGSGPHIVDVPTYEVKTDLQNDNNNNSQGIGGAQPTAQPTPSNEQNKAQNIVNPLVIKPYSYTTLTNEAIELNDNSEWVGGLAYHSASSAVAFIKNLAESYGYSTRVDASKGKTPREEFIKSNHFTYIDEANISEILATGSDLAKGMADVKVDPTHTLTLQEKRKVLQSIGKDGGMANNKNDYDNFTSGHLENYGLTSSNPNFGTQQFSVYPDYRTGNANVTIFSVPDGTTGEQVIRRIDVPSIIDKYPILSEEKLNEYSPYIRQLLYKFLEIYQGNAQTALDLSLITSETADQINFITNENLTKNSNGTYELKITNEELMEHLKKLNNGSTHWLALKALLSGFDSSLASDDLIPFTGDKVWPLENREPKSGVNDMLNIMGVTDWGGKGRLTLNMMAMLGYDPKYDLALVSIDQNHYYPITFVAGKTSDELYAINGVSDTKKQEIIDAIKQYNIDNAII